ncbi:hypothetical protein BC943DRAFT_320493 [Umbelopsis sp. AD052]|nr:hypothetical protein BC943DRAFT_320493 [Umbelopsis sp. AD052]
MSAAAIVTPSHQDLLSRDSKTSSTLFQGNIDQYPPDVENTLDAASGTARTPRPQLKNLPSRKDSLPDLQKIPSGPRRSKTANHVLQSLSLPIEASPESDAILSPETSTSLTKRISKVRPVIRRNTTGPDAIPSEELDLTPTSRKRQSFKRLSRRRRDDDDDRVIIGIRIAEGHQNYVLMYNMLTGIRIAVGRVSAKPSHLLTDEDFFAAHKLVFDVTGNELTPGARYDFKFKDYAPWVFRQIREKFNIDPADYLISLTSKYILSELGSPGKSGSFFYYSRDYRFIIKTISHTEHKFMRSILKEYHEHVNSHPNTLLCRYYGLHRVKLPRGRKIHFVVMANVFPPNKDVHETFDLKGSKYGRLLAEEEIQRNPNAVMKDLNWEKKGRKLALGPRKRRLFIQQLVLDVRLLTRLNIMDYSLLIGVHDMIRGNKDNIRDSTLHTFQPDTKTAERHASVMKRRQSKAQVVRKAIRDTNPNRIDISELQNEKDDRSSSAFYSDDGGFRSTDESDMPTNQLYFMGIIDILTPYDLKKKSEHYWKSMTLDKHGISAVKPSEYGHRFASYMVKTIEYNEDITTAVEEETAETKKNQ